ncbi:dethiobiotin synthase [Psittacicella melopsittaci]|uniref:ATP-dependent dethiobiotin synthetase BioD n=1 Tax=Psittacicella melopsittaci TaxID=2028576 RepID=A0A3A1YA11_9GAMM|nr:dethiobiotin synthase [Psittacicella melopsittaci]RIY32957.1 dethiobiotin synthase [Psittacicella melopsittaci]
MKAIIVCGIDTDIGKTYVSGSLLGQLIYNNVKVASYKPVQTGCESSSIDLEQQLALATEYCQARNSPKSLNNYLGNSKMCSYIFKTPASPHLAAREEQQDIKVAKILEDFEQYLNQHYAQVNLKNLITETYTKLDVLLVELAGGVLSPVNDLINNLDLINLFIAKCKEKEVEVEVVLVTAGKLGSISHTLAALSLLPQVDKLVYNYSLFAHNKQELDQQINEDNLNFYLNLQQVARSQKIVADNPLTLEQIKELEETDAVKQAYNLVTTYSLKDKYLITNTQLRKNLELSEIKKFLNLNSLLTNFF